MNYQINALETNGDFATDVEVQIQDRFTTGDYTFVYYDLRNYTNTTQAFFIDNQSYVTLPYGILYKERFKVEGQDFADLSAGNKLPIDLVLAKRPDIRLKKRSTILFDDCFGKQIGEFYLDNDDFSKASGIYVDAELKQPLDYSGIVSDNNYSGSYSPKSGLQEIKPC